LYVVEEEIGPVVAAPIPAPALLLFIDKEE